MITAEQTQALGLFADWVDPLNETFAANDINTPARVAAFVGQCAFESDNFKVLQENLDLKANALMKTFSRSRISEDDCMRYGSRAEIKQRADINGIANAIYGGDYGRKNLGNIEPEDGARFRGRGLFLLRGRTSYAQAGQALGVDLVESPELVALPQHAALTAGWVWRVNELNALADAGDIAAMTRKLGGSAATVDDRSRYIARVAEVLGT
jgi:putative chitinase